MSEEDPVAMLLREALSGNAVVELLREAMKTRALAEQNHALANAAIQVMKDQNHALETRLRLADREIASLTEALKLAHEARGI